MSDTPISDTAPASSSGAEIPLENGDGLPRPLEVVAQDTPLRDVRAEQIAKRAATIKAAQARMGTKESQEPGASKHEDARKASEHGRRQDDIKTAAEKVKQGRDADGVDAHRVAPSRFRPETHAAWEATPEPIKAEVHRSISNLENGLQKYKASHEAYEQVRQFDEIARRNGGNLRGSLEKVVAIEDAFQRNPIEGFHAVCSHFGIDMHKLATHISKMQPGQIQGMQQQRTVETLQTRLQQVEQQSAQAVQQMQRTLTQQQVASFAKDKPRFEELSPMIVAEINAGYDLDTAYDRAVKLAGGSGKGASSDRGLKSVTGAPSNGSEPPRKNGAKPGIRDALKNAMAQHGPRY